MGLQGVPFNVSKKKMIEMLELCRGNLHEVARRLGYRPNTIRMAIERMNLRPKVEQERSHVPDEYCDIAETVLERCMKDEKDNRTALAAAQFVLNNHGKKRGYAHPSTQAPIPTEKPKEMAELFRAMDAIQSRVVAERPLSNKGFQENQKRKS